MQDYLFRQPYIDLLKSIIANQSNNPSGYSFAIDGEWGCGKTWILNELETQLDNSYLIFHYNAWENDFYDELLVAILSVIISEIEKIYKKEQIIEGINAELAATSLFLLKNLAISFVNKTVQNKIGIDFRDVVDDLKDIKNAKSELKNIEKQVDMFLPLKKGIETIKKQLSEFSKHAAIVLIVDELDRCLPEYAIKVLERLHHICNDLPVIQILAINKKDLSFGIAKVFGMNNLEIDREKFADKYLQKFIQLFIPLNNGKLKEEEDILNRIDEGFTEVFSINKEFLIVFYKKLMNGITPRTQEYICKQVSLAHQLTVLSGHQMKYYSYGLLCCELLYCIKYCIFRDKSDFKIYNEDANIFTLRAFSSNLRCEIINPKIFLSNLDTIFRKEYQILDYIQLSPRAQDKEISAFSCDNGSSQLMNYFLKNYNVTIKWPHVYMMDEIFNNEREFLKHFKDTLNNF